MTEIKKLYVVQQPGDQLTIQPPVRWALGELEAALAHHGVSTHYCESVEQVTPDEACIVIGRCERQSYD